MKFTRHFLPAILGALMLCASAHADADNPYAAIVARNVFGLNPIPTNPPADAVPEVPPPKITPNGIMNIFGKLQALFKVAQPGKAGQPPHDESYMLTIGESQDDIEVTKIDEKAAVITFNNHGVEQELPLVAGVASSGAAPSGGVPPPGGPGGNPALGGGGRFGRNPNLPRNNVAAPGNSTAPSNPGGGQPTFGGGGNVGGGNAQPAEEALSPEAQVLLIEKNRLDTQDQVDAGKMPPLPPTALTPAEATAHDGSALIVDPVPVSPKK